MKEICEKYKLRGVNLSCQADKYKNHCTLLFECENPENCQKIYNYFFERNLFFNKISEGKYLITSSFEKLPLIRYYLNLIEKELK